MRSLWLVLGGALAGFLPTTFVDDMTPERILVVIATIASISVLFLLGLGIIQDRSLMITRRQRWINTLKIGILNDVDWDLNNAEIPVSTDINPCSWKETIESIAENKKLDVEVKYVSVNSDLEPFALILNPYGSAYPETHLGSSATLEKILDYVRNGGLFMNVADIPFYFAYSKDLRRRLDTAESIYVFSPSGGIGSVRPFQTVPSIKRLGLRIVPRDPLRFLLLLSTTSIVQICSERFAILEANMSNCLRYTVTISDANGKSLETTPIFFVDYGEGSFFISLMYIKAPYHDDEKKKQIAYFLCSTILDRLEKRVWGRWS